MGDLKIGVLGAAGRMGRAIVIQATATERCAVVAAADVPGSGAVGRDAGEIAVAFSRVLRGAGLAVPPGDPEAFAAALVSLLEAPERARAMGRAGREFVEAWASPAAVAERYEALFAELRSRLR